MRRFLPGLAREPDSGNGKPAAAGRRRGQLRLSANSMKDIAIYRGNIVFTPSPAAFAAYEQAYIVVAGGVVENIYPDLPAQYQGLPVEDYGRRLILPGFVDLHVHAPQFYQCGLGLDKELIEWLNEHTFSLESRFADAAHAREAYSLFADELVRQGTLRACIFATVHSEATAVLFAVLRQKGVGAFVGKVNMDRNCPDSLREDTRQSLRETEQLLARYGSDPLVKPIITPRFAPTSTEELLTGLGELAQRYQAPVQSHLSENRSEIRWVSELFASASYAEVYHRCGLFGQTPTLMAHGIYLTEAEVELTRRQNVLLVHCPDSNANVASGIMPLRRLLSQGLRVGLGSDVGGGHTLSMRQAAVRAIQLSKLVKVADASAAPLTAAEAYFLATKGGGRFFGKVGSFEPGYWFDALIVEDEPRITRYLSLPEQLQRFLYTGEAGQITARYVAGRRIG